MDQQATMLIIVLLWLPEKEGTPTPMDKTGCGCCHHTETLVCPTKLHRHAIIDNERWEEVRNGRHM